MFAFPKSRKMHKKRSIKCIKYMKYKFEIIWISQLGCFFLARRSFSSNEIDWCCDLRSIGQTCEIGDTSNENESARIVSTCACDPVLSPLVGTWSSYDLLSVLLPLEVRTVNLAIPTVTTWRFLIRLLRTRTRACVSRCFKPDPFRCLKERRNFR